MAIYHFSAQIIGRNDGKSAIAAAAYRAGEKIQDYDYTRKCGVDYSEILTPENAPEFAKNRSSLWTAIEATEKRKDAQLCREINFALPLELKPNERQELAKDFCSEFTRLGMVVDLTIHGQNSGNPHAHIMLTMRELIADGFGKKNRDWNRRELIEAWREKWAKAANFALEKAGHEARIDHRSLAAQGINREPTWHQGKAATHMPGQSWIKERNKTILDIGKLDNELVNTRRELNKIIVIERTELPNDRFETQKPTNEQPDKEKIVKIDSTQIQSPMPTPTMPTEKELNYYQQSLAEIAKKFDDAEQNNYKSIEYYIKWVNPYVKRIEESKTEHKTTFEKYKKVVEQDFTKDKNLLLNMSRSIGKALQGTGGTLAKQGDICKKLLLEIRLSQDRTATFNNIIQVLINEKAMSRSRGR